MSLVNSYADKITLAPDPKAVLDTIRRVKDREVSSNGIQTAVFSIAYRDPDYAVAYLTGEGVEASSDLLYGVGLRSKKQVSGSSFVSWIETLPESSRKPVTEGWLKANQSRLSPSAVELVRKQAEAKP